MKKTIVLTAVCGWAAVVHADVLDFNSIDGGEILAEQYASLGVHISTSTSDSALVYNTNARHGDDDLESLFEIGNIPLDTQLGNILVYQHGGFDFRSEDDDSHDNESQQLIFNFDMQVQSFGFIAMGFNDDLGEHASIEFFNGGVSALSISFDEFAAGGLYDNGALFGDHSLNQIDEISVAGGFDRVVINIGDSIGLDNVSFTVPAPSSTLVLGFAACLGVRRRR